MTTAELFATFPLAITATQKIACISNYVRDTLSASDKTQLPDSGLSISKRLEWQTYRDNLREIMASLDDATLLPENVVFPTEPVEE